MTDNSYIDIVFDGPPAAESGRFVEVENEMGASINGGEWLSPEDFPSHGEFWRLRIGVNRSMNNIQAEMHQIAKDSGFWDDDARKTPLEEVCLWMTECAEAAEETRKDLPLNQTYFMIKANVATLVDSADLNGYPDDLADALRKLIEMVKHEGSDTGTVDWLTDAEWAVLVRAGFAKPEGFGIEAADAVIRIMDTLEEKGISLAAMIELKASYNRTRPRLHGKTK